MVAFIAGAVTGAAIAAGFFYFRVRAFNTLRAEYAKFKADLYGERQRSIDLFAKAVGDLKQSYIKALEELVARPEAEIKAAAEALLAKAKSII